MWQRVVVILAISVLCSSGLLGTSFLAASRGVDVLGFATWPIDGHYFTRSDQNSGNGLGDVHGRLIIKKGPNSPSDHTYDSGSVYNEMLQLILTTDSQQTEEVTPEDVYLTDITITASGTGGDQTDIANVFLVQDVNGNGVVDDTEPVMATGRYPTDDSTITFSFSGNGFVIKQDEPRELSAYWAYRVKTLLVVYRMNPAAVLAPGATYQCVVTQAHAVGVKSGSSVSIVGYRESLPTATDNWRYLLWSATKTVPQEFSGTPSLANPVVLQFVIGNPTYSVNGSARTMDISPVIIENRTFLPIRYMAQELGATVDWFPPDKVEIKHLGKTIELWIGQNYAAVNGTSVMIDPDNPNVAPFIQDPGWTMMPLRFISENLGAKVEWLPPDEARITYLNPALP